MKTLPFLLVCVFLTACSNAQVADAVPGDTINMSPNIIRIHARVITAEKNAAVVEVIEVIAYGAGVVNILAEGQEVTIRLPDSEPLTANQTIEADLREKMGVDAGNSTYSLLSAKKIDR